MPPKAKNKKEVDIATPEIDLDAEEWIQNELADKKNGLQVTYEGPAGTYKIDDCVPNVDTATTSTVDSMDPGMELSYSFGTLDGQMSFDYEGDLRKKYPALQDAHEHYQNVKQMCETREKEKDGS